jgi:hypothetical protein
MLSVDGVLSPLVCGVCSTLLNAPKHATIPPQYYYHFKNKLILWKGKHALRHKKIKVKINKGIITSRKVSALLHKYITNHNMTLILKKINSTKYLKP